MPIMADLQLATNHLDEASLVAAAKLDVHAFTPLYRTYAPRIYAYCLHRMGAARQVGKLKGAWLYERITPPRAKRARRAA